MKEIPGMVHLRVDDAGVYVTGRCSRFICGPPPSITNSQSTFTHTHNNNNGGGGVEDDADENKRL